MFRTGQPNLSSLAKFVVYTIGSPVVQQEKCFPFYCSVSGSSMVLDYFTRLA